MRFKNSPLCVFLVFSQKWRQIKCCYWLKSDEECVLSSLFPIVSNSTSLRSSVVSLAHSKHLRLKLNISLQDCVPILYTEFVSTKQIPVTLLSQISTKNNHHQWYHHQKFKQLHPYLSFLSLKKSPDFAGHWGALGEPTAMGISLPSVRGHPCFGATWGSGSCGQDHGSVREKNALDDSRCRLDVGNGRHAC